MENLACGGKQVYPRRDFLPYDHDTFQERVAGVIVDADGALVAQELKGGFDNGAMEAIQEYFSEREAGNRDEVASGKKCEELYKKVYAANRAVREMLGVEKS